MGELRLAASFDRDQPVPRIGGMRRFASPPILSDLCVFLQLPVLTKNGVTEGNSSSAKRITLKPRSALKGQPSLGGVILRMHTMTMSPLTGFQPKTSSAYPRSSRLRLSLNDWPTMKMLRPMHSATVLLARQRNAMLTGVTGPPQPKHTSVASSTRRPYGITGCPETSTTPSGLSSPSNQSLTLRLSKASSMRLRSSIPNPIACSTLCPIHIHIYITEFDYLLGTLVHSAMMTEITTSFSKISALTPRESDFWKVAHYTKIWPRCIGRKEPT